MNIRSFIFSILVLIFSGIYALELFAVNQGLQDKLYQAILNDSKEEVYQALKLGASVNFAKDNKPPLLLALLLKRSNAAKFLLECGASVNEQYIEHAVKAREIELAVLIADKCCANLNALYSGQTLMQHAMNCGDITTVIWLINHGANFRDEKLLRLCGRFSDPSIFLELYKVIINHGYPVNDLWNSPAWDFWAGFGDNKSYSDAMVQLLIKNGANPNHIFCLNENESKKIFSTPLMKSISSRNDHAVKALLNSNANANLKANPIGWNPGKLYSPLSLAMEIRGTSNDPKLDTIVKLLIEHKAIL